MLFFTKKKSIVSRGAQIAGEIRVREAVLFATDSFLLHRLVMDRDDGLLNRYASAIGDLCSRKRAEYSLRTSGQEERQFQERLCALLKISGRLSRTESVDILLSGRPCRAAWDSDQVLAHIRSLSGSYFNARVVVQFLKLDIYPARPPTPGRGLRRLPTGGHGSRRETSRARYGKGTNAQGEPLWL
jgi:hypothetical protein